MKEEAKTKEQIIGRYGAYEVSASGARAYFEHSALEAMQEYADQQTQPYKEYILAVLQWLQMDKYRLEGMPYKQGIVKELIERADKLNLNLK
jgi:hypothetical protein